MKTHKRDARGLPVGVTAEQIEAYRESLRCMNPQTVWHTLHRAVVDEPDEVPEGFAWRIPIMRMHLILLEHRGDRFLADPATLGTSGDEREEWSRHSARRFDPPPFDVGLGGQRTPIDDEFERMRDSDALPGGLRPGGAQ